MDLKWIERTEQDEDGRPYQVHFLADMISGRAFGYVEEPAKGSTQFLFHVTPYEGSPRRTYIRIDSAKKWLLGIALQQAKVEIPE